MGSLRDLRKNSDKTDPEKSQFYSRLQELVIEHGNSWANISEVMEQEGFKEKDEPITPNALRKRYTRWKESQRAARLPVSGTTGVSSEPAASYSPVTGIEELVVLNKQLLAEVRDSHTMIQRLETRIEEQELKTNHTGIDTDPPVTTRDLMELLKDITAGRGQQMQFTEEESRDLVSRGEVQQLIEESVQDRVDAELKAMLAEEGSFAKEITRLMDHRLKTLFSGAEPVVKTPHAGPGRGKRGKTHKKFSASLEESLFERVRSLPGQFSGHLSNALEAYLSVVEEKKTD